MANSPDPVESLAGFVGLVRSIREELGREAHKELWFRGESAKYRNEQEKTFLKPVLYRPRSGRALKPIDDLLKIEAELYDSFSHSAVQLSGEVTEGENWNWDSYFLMQHHSAPTRLLDWSDGALIALHFALYSANDGKNDAIVYALDPDTLKKLPEYGTLEQEWKGFVRKQHLNEDYVESAWENAYLPREEAAPLDMPLLPASPLVLKFPHITRRVAAQRSRFVVFGREPDWLASRFGTDGFPMRAIVVKNASACKIKTELRDAGIVNSVIYPDLDGLGRELKRLWEMRE